jgi:hypothetical protein
MRNAAAVIALSLLSFSVVANAAEPRASYEQVLVPLFFWDVVSGANGSLWRTDFVGRNNGAASALAFQLADVAHLPETATSIPAGGIFYLRPARDYQNHANPGVFLYVAKAQAANVTFALRIRELSRQAADFVEVPVVRERDFATGATNLLDVPTGAQSRVHLRIYGASASADLAELTVRVFAGDAKLYEQVLTLTPPLGGTLAFSPETLLPNPAYAELANLTQVAGVANRGDVRVEIAPVTAGLRYWAFLAVTNNATQRVSLITPR